MPMTLPDKATYHYPRSGIAPYFLRLNLGLLDIYLESMDWTLDNLHYALQTRWVQNKARTAPIFRRCQTVTYHLPLLVHLVQACRR